MEQLSRGYAPVADQCGLVELIWIHNVPVANVGFVLARTGPAAGHRGMSIFIVDLHTPGVLRGKKERKMGQRASQVGALHFDNVQLGEDALLGQMTAASTSG